MKTTIALIVILTSLAYGVQAQQVIDDVYFRPGIQQEPAPAKSGPVSKPTYKNGAKEIIYIDSKNDKNIIISRDTIYILGEMNDSIAATDSIVDERELEEGYYLNEFSGGGTEYEYAERIRRFHNPKYTIHISDPQYTDIYFLNNHDWNVYVDGSYAWITPTWTNPVWDHYFFRPYSYNSWYWRNSLYSPYSLYYSSMWHNPWYSSWHSPWSYGGYYGSYYGGMYGGYYGGMYGGYYGGMYGWGNPFYNNYYGYSGFSKPSVNRNYTENRRRSEYYSGVNAGSGGSAVTTTRISGGSYSPAVTRSAVAADRTGRGQAGTESVVRATNSAVRGATGVSNDRNAPATRSSFTATGVNTRTRTTESNVARPTGETRTATSVPVVTTTPRTTGTVNTNSTTTRPSVNTTRTTNSNVRTGVGTSTVRTSPATTTSSPSTGTTPTRVATPSSSSSTSTPAVRSSTPTYSAPSSSGSSSGGSYSGGSSSGGSRSSGGSSGGRR